MGLAENLKLVTSMAKVLQQASVVEIFLCVAFVLVAHLLEGCSHMDKSEGGRGAADVFMGSNNESSGVFDKLPTPAPTPAPPPPTPPPPPPPPPLPIVAIARNMRSVVSALLNQE